MFESSVYRILKAAVLITSPAYILLSASDSFKDPSRRVHEMWQTEFTDVATFKGIARAPRWFDALSTARVRSFREIAGSEGVSEQYVSKLMPLASLAPRASWSGS